MSICVSIADDHSLVVHGITRLLQQEPDMQVVAGYSSGNALLEGLAEIMPDILLLDIQLPDKTGNEIIRILQKEYPELKVIALTSMDTIFHVKDMIRHGCMGYVTKQAIDDVLLEAIRQVYAGAQFIEEELEKRWMKSVMKSNREQTQQSPLSRREKEILRLIASEYTTQEIAEQLFLSQRTVDSHRYTLLQKLNVKNTAGLVRVAVQMGLLE